MQFHVRHTTHYRYDAPAVLGPHTIRLRPQQGPGVRLVRWSSHIQPQPAGTADIIDDAGNAVQTLWFAGSTSSLTIATSADIQTASRNPYDFIVTDPGALTLPVRYAKAQLLAAYLKPAQQSGSVARLAAKLARQARESTLQFVRIAAEHLAGFRGVIREEGPPMRPSETLAKQSGACRDLAVLYMDLCRWQGLAARFVSGYWRGARAVDRRHLHAWADVYLPGAGWRGFDPTTGFAVDEGYVPLAAAPSPDGAAPVEGTFGGGSIQSTLRWHLKIETRAGGA